MKTRLDLCLTSLALVAAACTSDEPYGGSVRYHTSLTQYQSCEALEADLKDMFLAELDTRFDQEQYWDRFGGLEDGAEEVVLGKHGVVVSKGLRQGVFLPHVATETGWTKEEFLRNLCAHKAGLPPDAYENGARLSVFTSIVFEEEH